MKSTQMKLGRWWGISLMFVAGSLAALSSVDSSAAEPPLELKEEAGDAGSVRAVDVSKSNADKSPSGSVERNVKRKKKDDLDRQLLRDLVPDLPLELPEDDSTEEETGDGKSSVTKPRSRVPFADELDETVEAMREVSRRMDGLNLADDTEELQLGIVTNIDALIEKLSNLPPPPSSSSDSSDKDQSESDSTSQGQKSQDQQRKPQQNPQQAPQKQQGADSTTGSAPQSGKAAESTEQNLRQARERAAALARRRAMIDEVWGHLPPAMRERLLNVGSEKLLPKYEDRIRRYYEALAEPEKSGSRR